MPLPPPPPQGVVFQQPSEGCRQTYRTSTECSQDDPPAYLPERKQFPDYLLSRIPRSENAEELSRFIHSTLRSYKGTSAVDLESLAQDIFLEAWVGQFPITRLFIRHRLLNALSSARVYRETLVDFPLPDRREYDHIDIHLSLDVLFSRSALSKLEVAVLYNIYYLGNSDEATGWAVCRPTSTVSNIHFSALEKLRREARRLSE